MKHTWIIEPSDVHKVRAFIALHWDNLFVKRRMERNLRNDKPPIDKAEVWQQLVCCLLTTQQRSGPTSPVSNFICTHPFPLAYDLCRQADDVEALASETLKGFGGLRRTVILPGEIAKNFKLLEGGLWEATLDTMNRLRSPHGVDEERAAANFVDDSFWGFGPKQARNLLQSLGLTRYEIPIDSRITKWLNDFGFPLRLSAPSLGDPDYYAFVMNGIQELCRASHVEPCILDAAIFASFDGGAWTEENAVW